MEYKNSWNIDKRIEYAHSYAERLKKCPTKGNVTRIVNEILHLDIFDGKITEYDIQVILSQMEKELGNYQCISETFDNQATLSLISEVHKQLQLATGGQGK